MIFSSGKFNGLISLLMALLAIPAGAILASNSAIPGEPMYPVKTGLEKVAGFLISPSYQARSDLEIKLIERRIEENQQLLLSSGSTEGLNLLLAQAQSAAQYIVNSNTSSEAKSTAIKKLTTTIQTTQQTLKQERQTIANKSNYIAPTTQSNTQTTTQNTKQATTNTTNQTKTTIRSTISQGNSPIATPTPAPAASPTSDPTPVPTSPPNKPAVVSEVVEHQLDALDDSDQKLNEINLYLSANDPIESNDNSDQKKEKEDKDKENNNEPNTYNNGNNWWNNPNKDND